MASTPSTRMKGTDVRFELGTTEGVLTDYSGDISSIVATPAESEQSFSTFYDMSKGGSIDWTFNLTLQQSQDADSLWKFLYDNAGTSLYFAYNPTGAAAASSTSPDFVGKLTPTLVGLTVGGEASTDVWTSDVELKVDYNTWDIDTGA